MYFLQNLKSTPQNCQGHKKRRKMRICHWQEETKETLLNTRWFPGLDPEPKKDINVKTGEIWIKSEL